MLGDNNLRAYSLTIQREPKDILCPLPSIPKPETPQITMQATSSTIVPDKGKGRKCTGGPTPPKRVR